MAKNRLMKQEIKNVIITFGLIATALISGSFLYQKKIGSENLLAVKQEQLQSMINEQQVILDKLNQQAGAQAVVATQSIPTKIPTSAQPTISKQAPVVKSTAVATAPSPQPSPVWLRQLQERPQAGEPGSQAQALLPQAHLREGPRVEVECPTAEP